MRHESLIVERRSSDPVLGGVGPIGHTGMQRRASSVSRPTSPAFSDASSFDSGDPAWWVEVEDLYDTYHFDSRRSSMSPRASFCSVRPFMNPLGPSIGYDPRSMSPDSSHLKTPRPTIAPLPYTDDWADLSTSRPRPKQPVFVPSQPPSSSGASRPAGTITRHRKLLSIEEGVSDLKQMLSGSLVEPDIEVEVEAVSHRRPNEPPGLVVIRGPNEPLKKRLGVPNEKHRLHDCSLADMSVDMIG